MASEFGAGIVVCLAKFSEHFNDRRIYDPRNAMDISELVWLWLNAASDHFYDLDERAPEPLKALAAVTLEIGHGHGSQKLTLEHVDKVRELWRESCLAVDQMLGVESDWGEY